MVFFVLQSFRVTTRSTSVRQEVLKFWISGSKLVKYPELLSNIGESFVDKTTGNIPDI